MMVDELAKELNMEYEDIKLYIASLRKMYRDGEIDKCVCFSDKGYYLKNEKQKDNHIMAIDDYDLMEVKKRTDDIVNDVIISSDNRDVETLTLDIKKQSNESIKLLKINVTNEENKVDFSITLSI